MLVTGLQGTGKSTIADRVADALAAPVFSWDWFMAALTPFESVQATLRSLDATTYRSVGWALMLQAGRAQLRRGLPVVLDGLAREGEIQAVRALGRECSVRTVIALTTCQDAQVVRSRIEGRLRGIPGWHELTWEQVARTRDSWVQPSDVDVVLDSLTPVDDLVIRVMRLLQD